MKTRQFLIGVLVLGVIGTITTSIFAATKNANFSVTATVVAACSISTSPGTMAFGNYDGSQPNNDNGTSTFGITCSPSTTYALGLDPGQNYSGTRRMRLVPSDYLNYEIYQDSGRTVLWTDIGTGGAVSATGTGSAQSYTAYGRAPTGQFPVAGIYSDQVQLTVQY
jgi:spore coat protein U-like protein